MKIPDKLKIGRSTWKVKFDDTIVDSNQAVGLCDISSKKIILYPNQSRNELEETFLHEILHACWPEDACGVRLEEKIIEKLSPVLLKVLKKNGLFDGE